MTEAGIPPEEQDHIVTFFALSAGMVLAMGEVLVADAANGLSRVVAWRYG